MSKAEEFEEKIREKRILEANKKGLMGQNGKIGVVLRIFGQPIIDQSEGGFYVDTNYLQYDNNIEKKSLEEISDSIEFMKNIPIMDVEGSERPNTAEWSEGMPDAINYTTNQIGFHFDGLSRGMHMEIKYDDLTSEIVVSHKGYVVYKEIKGELLGYAPGEWEEWIEKLYKVAKEKQRKTKEEEFEKSIKENKRQKNEWWDKMISRWGIK